MDEKLKPCPFCGGKAYIDGERHWWVVVCDACKCRLGENNAEFETKEEAIEAWNTRAIEQQLQAGNKQLRDALDTAMKIANINQGIAIEYIDRCSTGESYKDVFDRQLLEETNNGN